MGLQRCVLVHPRHGSLLGLPVSLANMKEASQTSSVDTDTHPVVAEDDGTPKAVGDPTRATVSAPPASQTTLAPFDRRRWWQRTLLLLVLEYLTLDRACALGRRDGFHLFLVLMAHDFSHKHIRCLQLVQDVVVHRSGVLQRLLLGFIVQIKFVPEALDMRLAFANRFFGVGGGRFTELADQDAIGALAQGGFDEGWQRNVKGLCVGAEALRRFAADGVGQVDDELLGIFTADHALGGRDGG